MAYKCNECGWYFNETEYSLKYNESCCPACYSTCFSPYAGIDVEAEHRNSSANRHIAARIHQETAARIYFEEQRINHWYVNLENMRKITAQLRSEIETLKEDNKSLRELVQVQNGMLGNG